MGARERIQALIAEMLPWYDPKEADRHDALFRAQLEDSRQVRANATRAIRASRRDRIEIMRGSFRRAGRRLGER